MLIESTLAAFLVGVITGTVQGVGKETAKALVEKVKSKMLGEPLTQLNLLEASPENTEYQSAVKDEITSILKKNEALKAEVAEVMQIYTQNNVNFGDVDTAIVNPTIQNSEIQGDLVIGKKL